MEKIIVLYEELANIKSYYAFIYGILIIHINSNLSKEDREREYTKCVDYYNANKNKRVYVFL